MLTSVWKCMWAYLCVFFSSSSIYLPIFNVFSYWESPRYIKMVFPLEGVTPIKTIGCNGCLVSDSYWFSVSHLTLWRDFGNSMQSLYICKNIVVWGCFVKSLAWISRQFPIGELQKFLLFYHTYMDLSLVLIVGFCLICSLPGLRPQGSIWLQEIITPFSHL